MKTHRIKMTTPSLYLALLFLLIQQGIVGLSTYFIADLAIDIAKGRNFIINLAGFILSLVIVYVPAYFASVYLEKAKFDMLDGYIQKFHEIFLGKAFLLNNVDIKEQSTVFVSQESKAVIDDMLDFLFDGIALILNLLFNIIVLGFFLDFKVVIAYLLGFVMVEFFIFYHQKVISKTARIAQKSRISFISTLNKIWDNIVILNKYNLDLFNTRYKQNFNRAQKHHISNHSASNLVASLGMILFMLPVLGLICYLFIQNQANYVFLAVLVATLPRQIQLLQMGQALVFHQTNFSSIRAKFIGLKNSLQVPNMNILDRINFKAISMNGVSLQEIDYHHLPKTGRMTIKGCNGAGKSSFLLHLKTLLSDRAFYLPAKHNLLFCRINNQSTGQNLLANLKEIHSSINDIEMIILDEWDANLDEKNKSLVDDMIDKLSKERLVIEVRH